MRCPAKRGARLRRLAVLHKLRHLRGRDVNAACNDFTVR